MAQENLTNSRINIIGEPDSFKKTQQNKHNVTFMDATIFGLHPNAC